MKLLGNVTASQVRCEYFVDPLGIDIPQPRLSWVVECDDQSRRDVRQTAFQIVVTGDSESAVWDSGKVESSETVGIPYGGKLLQPLRHRVHRGVDVGNDHRHQPG